jgi:hypothetical protein
MVMGELAELPPPPPPELHPAAAPTMRTALAAALLATRRRRERSGSLAAAARGFRKSRRAKANRESSIKAPFGFSQDCMPARPFFILPFVWKSRLTSIIREKSSMKDVYRTLNKASTVYDVSIRA